MKKSNMKKSIILALVIFITGLSASAYARCGGQGYGMQGKGFHQGKGFPMAQLSEEDQAKVEAERKAFYESTSDLRRDMASKSLEMRSEMVKKDADVEKLSAIQKELSGFQAEFAQKKLEHMLNMKKIIPEFGMGRGACGFGGQGQCGKGMRGKGYHHGRGMMQGNAPSAEGTVQ